MAAGPATLADAAIPADATVAQDATAERNPTAEENPTATKDASPTEFDIVQAYQNLIASDPDITKPCAAMVAMIELLRATKAFTSMETVEIVEAGVARLLASVANPLPLEAGTRVFSQFLQKSLRGQPSGVWSSAGAAADSALASKELQSFLNGTKQLVRIAKQAREQVGSCGSIFVRSGSTVMIYSGSRAVTSVLLHARCHRARRFKVVQVVADPDDAETVRTAALLRRAGISIRSVGFGEVVYALSRIKHVDLVLVGAEALVRNGGIISRMGTLTLAKLAKTQGKRFYVAAETHKMVPKWPALQNLEGVGIKQDSWQWETASETGAKGEVDHTPPDLIDLFLTDSGAKIPSLVDKEILQMHEMDM